MATADSPEGTSSLTIDESMAMEKELYEESIRVLEKRLVEVQNGSFSEYVERCREFEAAKNNAIDMAKLHRDLLLRNIQDLLDFDLQQIQDVFEASVEALSTHPPDVIEIEGPPPADFETSLTIDTDAQLLQAFQESALRKYSHFNLDHIRTCLPRADDILSHCVSLRESLELVNSKVQVATHLDCHYDSATDVLHVGNLALTTEDPVILTSEIAQEEFYGTIHRINDSIVSFPRKMLSESDQMHLELLCGNQIQVTLQSLRERKCLVRFQDSSKNSPIQPSPSTRKTAVMTRTKRNIARKRLVSLI
ncbi:hypothetical protein LEN26_015683 [Aphanomyces euteiches]|nr:hypothetical protein LEN26_015683 [Aphanomyces euteiches]KAH9118470.1 hypothetical protein AeMF1_008398 [Aphanomyces euteiches]KAH9184724.1 hypothetical protein AeNC1_013301 [Aphanomyces euteiches]